MPKQNSAYFDPGFWCLDRYRSCSHGEKLARQGLELMMGLLRVAQTKRNLYMAIVEGRGDDLLNTKITIAPQIGTYLLELLSTSQRRTFLPATTVHTFELNAVTTGKNPIIPIIKAEDSKIKFTGTGIFNKRQLIAKVGLRDTRSLVMLRGLKTAGLFLFLLEKRVKGLMKAPYLSQFQKVRVENNTEK